MAILAMSMFIGAALTLAVKPDSARVESGNAVQGRRTAPWAKPAPSGAVRDQEKSQNWRTLTEERTPRCWKF